MRTSIALIAGLGLAFGTATAALAGDDTMKPGAADATTGAAVSAQAPLQGEVTQKQGETLTIRSADGESAQVRTTDSTKFRGQTGEIDFNDIEAGDQVRVTSIDSGDADEHVAREIQVVARGTGDSEIRDPRQMSPGQNPIQGTPDHDSDRDDMGTR